MILKAFQVTILHLNQFVCIYSKYILNNIYTSLQAFGVSHLYLYFMFLIEVSYAHQDCIRKMLNIYFF